MSNHFEYLRRIGMIKNPWKANRYDSPASFWTRQIIVESLPCRYVPILAPVFSSCLTPCFNSLRKNSGTKSMTNGKTRSIYRHSVITIWSIHLAAIPLIQNFNVPTNSHLTLQCCFRLHRCLDQSCAGPICAGIPIHDKGLMGSVGDGGWPVGVCQRHTSLSGQQRDYSGEDDRNEAIFQNVLRQIRRVSYFSGYCHVFIISYLSNSVVHYQSVHPSTFGKYSEMQTYIRGWSWTGEYKIAAEYNIVCS